jgi:hypothetical protein
MRRVDWRGSRASRKDVVIAVLAGVLVNWAAWQSFVNYSGWVVPDWALLVAWTGSPLVAVALSRTGLVQAAQRRADDMSTLTAASFYVIAAGIWALGWMIVFGTRPPASAG